MSSKVNIDKKPPLAGKVKVNELINELRQIATHQSKRRKEYQLMLTAADEIAQLTVELATSREKCERLHRVLFRNTKQALRATAEEEREQAIGVAVGALNTRLENAGIVLDFLFAAAHRAEDDCWVIRPFLATSTESTSE